TSCCPRIRGQPATSGGPMRARLPVFERYELLGTLGRGGFATVYRAHNRALDRVVALKVVRPEVNEEPEAQERVLGEARRIARARDQTPYTRTGLTFGTPETMAPEQVLGGQIGPATDVYALALIVYRLLAGQAPFSGDAAQVMFAHAYSPPPSQRDLQPGLP